MARLLGLTALAATLAALAGCGGGSGPDGGQVASGRPITLEQLSAAARTSADAASGRFSFAFAISGAGLEEPLSFSGEGAFDAAAERASFTMDLSSFGTLFGGLLAGLGGGASLDDASAWVLEAVQDGDAVYVRLPALAQTLPPGKTWVRADEALAGQGFDFSQFQDLAENDPRELLELLEAVSGRIRVVGAEELRGVQTTHYRAELDPARFGELAEASEQEEGGALVEQLLSDVGVGAIPLDIWTDGSGLVRKLSLTVEATQPGTSETGRAEMTFELWDYGEDVEIAVPPASQVADAAALEG
jgi:hypothetical protein